MTLRVLWRNKQTAAELEGFEPPSGIELRVETHRERAAALGDWATVLVDGNPSDALLDNPSLQHVVVPFAGLNEELQRRAQARPHLVVHNSHYNSAMVAQHAVALLLAVASRVVPADKNLRRGRWNQAHDHAELGVFLQGGKALLLGYGAIAKAAAPTLRGLGLELTAFRQHPQANEGVSQVGIDDLDTALAAADVVLASLPLTPATEGLLDARRLALLKSSAILVNVGRGRVIDENALYSVLAEGRIYGAGLDVWYSYPASSAERDDTLPASRPFHELDNVVMTPHSADNLGGWQRAAIIDTFATLRAIAEGRERNVVDVFKGY